MNARQINRCYKRVLSNQLGFSLVEMAIVLVIMGLVVWGATTSLVNVNSNLKAKETNSRLQQAKDAILNYVLVNGRLPCPATNISNGLEVSDINGVCQPGGDNNGQAGYLPSVTLGMSPLDSFRWFNGGWDDPVRDNQGRYLHAIRYAVSDTTGQLYEEKPPYNLLSCPSTTAALTTKPKAFNAIPSPPYPINCGDSKTLLVYKNFYPAQDANGFLICPSIDSVLGDSTCPQRGGNIAQMKKALIRNAAVVIWSTGENGAKNPQLNIPQYYGLQEVQNWNQTPISRLFYHHSPTIQGSLDGQFDDQVIWISYPEIVGKLIQGGHVN